MCADKKARSLPKSFAVAAFISLAACAGIAFAACYAVGAQLQWEGAFLTVALGALAAALILWERLLMPHAPAIEEREVLRSDDAARAAAVATLCTGGEAVVGRRAWLARLFAGATAIVGISALFPLRSLTPGIGRKLRSTAWARGSRLVRADGSLVNAGDIEMNSVLTVFPEGHTGPEAEFDMANSATLLIRIPENELVLPDGRKAGAPAGLIALSKVCTHAGCPVALYRAADRQLFCPCHQSAFDVRRGGERIFGPADKALPQLPIAIAADGTLLALGDFPGPVGPPAWST